MSVEKWNETQLKLLSNLLGHNNSGDVLNIAGVVKLVEEANIIWKDFYDLLIEYINDGLLDRKYISIMSSRVVEYNNREFIIIKDNFLFYSIIDVEKRKTISKISEEFYNKNLYEERDGEIDFTKIDLFDIDDAGIDKVIDVVKENSDVLGKTSFSYNLRDFKGNRIFISFKISDASIIVGMQSIDGDINYIFIDKNLLPVGMSNPTGNIEEIKEMCLSIEKIEIPKNVIPEYLYQKKRVKSKRR